MNDPPPQPKYKIDAPDSEIGFIGDGARVDTIRQDTYIQPRSLLTFVLGRKERVLDLSPTEQRRNRENLLQNIKATWIDGYLHNAVHRAVYMELGLEYKRDAVSRPWDLTLQPVNTPIPHDKPIGALFKEHGRSLLILGDPASGKTITLLQLAEELLAEAQQDDTCPIPVILNLSSWAQERQTLADWLVEELFIAYQLAGPFARF